MATDKKQKENVFRRWAKLYHVPLYVPKELLEALKKHPNAMRYKSLSAYFNALAEADIELSVQTKKTEV